MSLFCSLLMLAGCRHEELLCQEEQKAGWLQGSQEQDRVPLGPHGPSDLASAACHPFIHACAHTSREITPTGLTWGCSSPPGGRWRWSCLGRPPEPLWSGGGHSPRGRESGQESSARRHSKWPLSLRSLGFTCPHPCPSSRPRARQHRPLSLYR